MFAPDLEDDVIPDDPAPLAAALVDDHLPEADPVEQLVPKVDAMATLVKNTKAVDDASYLVVCEQTKGINALIAEVDATFDPLVVNARKAVEDAKAALESRKADLDTVRATKAKHRGPLEQALTTNKGELVRFIDAKEAAAKKVREEADRVAMEAAAEQRAKDVEREVAAGRPDQAAALAAKPLPQPTQMVAPKSQSGAAPKAAGIVPKKEAKATVTDLAALIVAVADKLLKPELAGPPLDVLTVGKAKLNTWATNAMKGPVVGASGIEITSASATVTDMGQFVLFAADFLRHYKGEGDGDPSRFLDFIEHVPSVLNKWTSAQGTALNWPGVSVEMVTDVSASRRG